MRTLFVLFLALSFNLSVAGTGDIFRDGVWYMAPICDGGGCIYGDENSRGYGNGTSDSHDSLLEDTEKYLDAMDAELNGARRSDNQNKIKDAVSNFEKRLLANDGNLFSGGYSSEAFEKMTNFTRALNENLRAEILNDTQDLKDQTEAELHTNTDAANDYISKYNFGINALIETLPFLNAAPTFKSASPKVKNTALYSNFVAKTVIPENQFLADAAKQALVNADALAASGNSDAAERELSRANHLLDNALAPDTVPDVDWKSSGDNKNKLIDLHKKISKVRPTTPDQALGKQMGLAALLASDEASANGDPETAKLASDIAAVGLDLAIGLTPGLNFGQALYETYTGQSIVTGEDLGKFGRAMAILGVATLGGSKLIQPFLKLIGKVGEAALKLATEASRNRFREAVSLSNEFAASAERLGITETLKNASDVATNAATKEKLWKQLASESQMAEKGTIIAGGNGETIFRNAEYAAQKYGGSAADYVKKSSSGYKIPDGRTISTHWIENIKTGERFEFKTIIE